MRRPLFALPGNTFLRITRLMSEFSDLALLGIGAAALFVIYVLRVLLGGKRAVVEEGFPDNAILVDGSNVMFWGGDPSAHVLKSVVASLVAKGFAPYVIFDANVGYKLSDRYLDDAPMAKLIDVPVDRVLVVEKGISADDRILEIARDQGLRVVTNDRFRDWKGTYPMISKKGFFVRGSFKGGNVQWQSI